MSEREDRDEPRDLADVRAGAGTGTGTGTGTGACPDPARSEPARPAWLVERLQTAPKRPGCYLMKDRLGDIVYVGKANDLRARLGQYFGSNPGDTRFFVGLLARVLGSIEVIVTSSGKEALILENTLIKEHQPRFNVKLKDDKNFLTIRVGKEHAWPRLEVVRRRKRDSADYFGPYHSATAIRQTLRIINRYFQLRTCRDSEFKNRARPCLEHQIGRCPAPCVTLAGHDGGEAARYADNVADVKLFLSGRGDALVGRLKAKMLAASEGLEFEAAARYRDQVEAIRRSLAPQTVLLKEAQDIDVIGFYREGADLVVQVLLVRRGVIVGSRAYPMRKTGLPDGAVVDGFLSAWYDGHRPVPDLVLLPAPPDDVGIEVDTWAELLSESRGRAVALRHPQRGDKRRLLEMANENAKTTFLQKRKSAEDQMEIMVQLQQRLRLRELPRRIECYDISNIQGTDPVGSMVVAIDGALAPKEYRHYAVRSLDTPNDFAMMLEVLTRRFRRAEQEGHYPDLILLDGGKGQLAVAVQVLKDLGVDDVEIASLAKSRVLDAKGQVKRDSHERPSSEAIDRSTERVFRPNIKDPMGLRSNSNTLFLLQRLRDEAHRFAITFHRKRRSKRTLGSSLDKIEGIGEAKRKALLRHFGSIKAIKAASVSELRQCPGISEVLAHRVVAALRG